MVELKQNKLKSGRGVLVPYFGQIWRHTIGSVVAS